MEASETNHSSVKGLSVLFAVAIIIRLVLVFSLPIFPETSQLPVYNDEPLHLFYASHMAEFGVWPIYEPDPDRSFDMTAEFVQPPVYYALAAYPLRIAERIGFDWGYYGARLMSVIFGMIAALFTYRIVMLWRDDRQLAAGAFVAMLFAPNAVVFTSLVTNDSALMGLAAVAVYSILICRSQGINALWRQIFTGVFLASTVWVKMSGLLLLPLAWFAAGPLLSNVDRWTIRVRVLLISICCIGPLFVWNVIHYGQIVPFAIGYSPEEVMGEPGGALVHPIKAAMLFFRYAPMPYHDLWGSVHEKIISLVWVLIMGGLTVYGAFIMARKENKGWLFFLPIGLVLAGLAVMSIDQFQVEFRLLSPCFWALAVLASAGARAVRMPIIAQVFLWISPLSLFL